MLLDTVTTVIDDFKENAEGSPGNHTKSERQLILFDLQDSCSILEESIISILAAFKSGSISTTVRELLHNLTPVIERTAKFMKGSVDVSSCEFDEALERTTMLLRRLVDDGANCSMKAIPCSLLLQLALPRVESKGGSVVVEHILQATRVLYSMQSAGSFGLSAKQPSTASESNLETLPYDDEEDSPCSEEYEYEGSDVYERITEHRSDDTEQSICDVIISLLRICWAKLKTAQFNERLIESSIYATGYLRVHTSYEKHRRRLLRMDFIDLLHAGLQMVLTISSTGTVSGNTSTSLQLAQLSTQLVSVVRNFVVDASAKQPLLSSEIVATLCSFIHVYRDNPDLILNCSRVIAKLSLQDSFRSQINKRTYHLKCLIEAIVLEAKKCSQLQQVAWLHAVSDGASAPGESVAWPTWYTWPLVSRVAFTLGNLTTSNEVNRKMLTIDCKCLKPIVLLLQTCACSLVQVIPVHKMGSYKPGESYKVQENSCDDDEDDDKADHSDNGDVIFHDKDGERELCDATMKLLRLLANLCLEDTAGNLSAARPEVFSVILELLQRLEGSEVGVKTCFDSSTGVFDDDLVQYEELLLNCISLTTNLTYYACQIDGDSSSSKKYFVAVANSLSKFLFHENDDIVLEACRALGNLTRNACVLKAFSRSRIDDALNLLLQHSNIDILASVIGIYINATCFTDTENEAKLYMVREPNCLVETLTMVLRRLSLKAPGVSCMICKVFHNLLSLCLTISSVLTEKLLSTLVELLDCAEDLSEDGKFDDFISIGHVVSELISA